MPGPLHEPYTVSPADAFLQAGDLLASPGVAALQREIAELGKWLAAQGLDLGGDHAHADEGSRDRLYWRYGYFVGLKEALAMLTARGGTFH
jgi:hypothetical protein